MMKGVALVLLFSVAISAEQCRYPTGGVSFSYEKTEDEEFWYGKYKGGFGQYRKRRVTFGVSNMDGDGAPDTFWVQQQQQIRPFSNLNAPPIFSNRIQPPIQQQQETIHFQGPIRQEQQETNEEGESTESTTQATTTTTTEKPEPLPIWKLKVPRHARKVSVRRIEDSAVVDSFELDEEDLLRGNLTSVTDKVRTIDVTQKDIQPSAWYLICVDVEVIINGNSSTCRDCSLIKSCETPTGYSTCSSEAISSGELTEFSSGSAATVIFSVQDLPFENGQLIVNVFFDPQYRRCAPALFDKPRFTYMSLVIPETQIIVEINDLKEGEAYVVKSDLSVELADGEEIFLKNYGDSESISRCTSYDRKYSALFNGPVIEDN